MKCSLSFICDTDKPNTSSTYPPGFRTFPLSLPRYQREKILFCLPPLLGAEVVISVSSANPQLSIFEIGVARLRKFVFSVSPLIQTTKLKLYSNKNKIISKISNIIDTWYFAIHDLKIRVVCFLNYRDTFLYLNYNNLF